MKVNFLHDRKYFSTSFWKPHLRIFSFPTRPVSAPNSKPIIRKKETYVGHGYRFFFNAFTWHLLNSKLKFRDSIQLIIRSTLEKNRKIWKVFKNFHFLKIYLRWITRHLQGFTQLLRTKKWEPIVEFLETRTREYAKKFYIF